MQRHLGKRPQRRNSCPPRHGARALSLLELLIAMAVFAVLLGVGVPGFRQLLLEARMTASVNALVHDLHLARQTALVQSRTVLLCPNDGLGHCDTTSGWGEGWLVAVAASGESGPAAPPLAGGRVAPGIRLWSNRQRFAFRPYTLRDTNGSFGFCDARGPAAARALIVSPTGRPRLVSGAEARTRINCSS